MKKILATAYAVNPYKGSEDGTGWNFSVQIARFNEVTVITRKNNRAPIEKFISENPRDVYKNLSFEYFDLPLWMRFWKKGNKGALIYVYLWQLFVPVFILRKRLKADIVHNLNFHSDWMPSFLWMLGKPFVWGPVGHHDPIPDEYAKDPESLIRKLAEFGKRLTKAYFWKVSPSHKISSAQAKKILTINSGVSGKAKFNPKKTIKIPAVGAIPQDLKIKDNPSSFTILSVGRFVSLKGFEMTIRSFSEFMGMVDPESRKMIRLTLVGKGPLRSNLNQLIDSLSLGDHVEILEWIPQDELFRLYETASVFFFPSFEGAGMVIPEAMSYGLPILTYDNYGPGELAGPAAGCLVSYTSPRQSRSEFAGHLFRLFSNPEFKATKSRHALDRVKHELSWNKKGEFLNSIYNEISA